MDPDEIMQRGERVLVVGRLQGRGRQSGMDVDSPMARVMTFENGKVASVRTYVSVAAAREAAELGG
jgi:ketosteroid isomerase-like protein